MVGAYLVEELIKNMKYTAIKVYTRRPIGIEHIKVIEKIIDVESPASYSDDLRGDDLFICLGTTMRRAGSIKRYEEIDRDLPVSIAKASFNKGVSRIAVVSSIGANSDSKSYYSRIKGEMEKGILEVGFERTVIARPSLLLGERKEFRLLEKVAKAFAWLFSFLMTGRLKVYKAIHGRDVAIAMIDLLAETSDKTIYLSNELQEIVTTGGNINVK